MRVLVATIGALTVMAMASQTQATDWNVATVGAGTRAGGLFWDVLTVYGHPIPPPATVSFSIGYPKGWLTQEYRQERQDIYNNGILVAPLDPGPICIFGQPAITNTLEQQSFTTYLIWRAGAGTARENAEAFFNGKRSTETEYCHKSIKAVKTSAGDSGWLVESEGYITSNPAVRKLVLDPDFMKTTNAWNEILALNKTVKPDRKIPVTFHDFFFHSGSPGAIQIEIMTHTANASWRSQMDRMVLGTLRFGD